MPIDSTAGFLVSSLPVQSADSLSVSKPWKIGIDLMGGDSSPQAFCVGIDRALVQLPGVEFTLFVTSAALASLRGDPQNDFLWKNPRCHLHVVDECIEMGDDPLVAIRSKKHSSIVVALKQHKKRHLDAVVSAGNTGALMLGSALWLPRLPYIQRPALLAILPSRDSSVAMLDIGGVLGGRSVHLEQFALLGALFQKLYHKIECPRVALLNVGTESKKGTLEIRNTYASLSKGEYEGFQFVGNIEPNNVFKGLADVVVSNGFAGNIFLKTAEGMAEFMLSLLGKELNEYPLMVPVIETIQQRFITGPHHGACICGVDGVVIKCHGASSGDGLFHGIAYASDILERRLITKLKDSLSTYPLFIKGE